MTLTEIMAEAQNLSAQERLELAQWLMNSLSISANHEIRSDLKTKWTERQTIAALLVIYFLAFLFMCFILMFIPSGR